MVLVSGFVMDVSIADEGKTPGERASFPAEFQGIAAPSPTSACVARRANHALARSSAASKNISLGASGKSTLEVSPSCPERGALAIVTNVGRDAVDAAASARKAIAGRIHTRERSAGAQTNGADAYGKTVWFWHPLLVSSCRWRDRSDRIRFPIKPAATVTRGIRRRGEHGISRKAIAQGMPDASAEPVCSCAFFRALLHTRPRVQRAPGIPLLPLGSGSCNTSDASRRETADAYSLFEI
jgi:hypothetical protein